MTAPLAVCLFGMMMAGAAATVNSAEQRMSVGKNGMVRQEAKDSHSVSLEPDGAITSESEGTLPLTTDNDDQDPAQYTDKHKRTGVKLGATATGTIKLTHKQEIVLEGSKAENCPWLNGVSTGTSEMLCWDATTCDPSKAGDGCCKAHGGVLQCPDEMPKMCHKKDCEGDHCCKIDCDVVKDGGNRLCTTGPEGETGKQGAPGPKGKRGLEGHLGHEGHEGHLGKVGPPGEPGPEGPMADDTAPGSAATVPLLIGVAALNAIMAIGMYMFLKFLRYMHAKNPSSGNVSY